MPPQLTTYTSASGLTLTSIGSIDAGGGTPAPSRTAAASALGVVGGSSSQTLTVNQLPQHKHTLRGSAGNQYYAFRYAVGTPTDTGAIVGQNHNAFNGIHMLPDSGNMDAVGAVGQPFDIVNPYQTINYIIFTGVI
jgi:microcystin-dependent protein